VILVLLNHFLLVLRTLSNKGTPPFMAPELLSSSPQGEKIKVDSYAFGMLFYEMLKGSLPWDEMYEEFRGKESKILEEMGSRVMAGRRPPLDTIMAFFCCSIFIC